MLVNCLPTSVFPPFETLAELFPFLPFNIDPVYKPLPGAVINI
jgi:hypothetical protein